MEFRTAGSHGRRHALVIRRCIYVEPGYVKAPVIQLRFPMTKNELIAAIAEDTAKSKADVGAVLTSLAAVVVTTLKDGGDVTLGSIGKLSAAKRDARQARNPSTGAVIDVPAKTVVKFKVAKDLADAVA